MYTPELQAMAYSAKKMDSVWRVEYLLKGFVHDIAFFWSSLLQVDVQSEMDDNFAASCMTEIYDCHG